MKIISVTEKLRAVKDGITVPKPRYININGTYEVDELNYPKANMIKYNEKDLKQKQNQDLIILDELFNLMDGVSIPSTSYFDDTQLKCQTVGKSTEKISSFGFMLTWGFGRSYQKISL